MMIERMRRFMQSGGRYRPVLLLGAAGILLILLSGIRSRPDRRTQSTVPQAEPQSAVSSAAYCTQLEEKLTGMLSELQGVGHVRVTVTVSRSEEQIFAEEVKSSKSDRAVQQESRIVITKSNGQETALVSGTNSPAVQGVAVLCSGGDHASVRESVTAAVSTVLGLSPAQIFVGKTVFPSQ